MLAEIARGVSTTLTIKIQPRQILHETPDGNRRSRPAEAAAFSMIPSAIVGCVGYSVPMHVRGAPFRIIVLTNTPLRTRKNAGIGDGGSITVRVFAYSSNARRASAST